MQTSYFARLREINAAGLVPVSIALKSPAWYHGPVYKPLNPTGWMLAISDERVYAEKYFGSVLGKRSAEQVLRELTMIGDLDKLVLLCWESLKEEGEFCHRRMVADWLQGEMGLWVPEFQGAVVEATPAGPRQKQLF